MDRACRRPWKCRRNRPDRARLVLAGGPGRCARVDDRRYFALTGGVERWLYRVVRKHAGRQSYGGRFEFRHLHAKSASLSPLKRFAFELRDIVRQQPLPGYRLVIEHDGRGRKLLAFAPGNLSTDARQHVETHGLSGTDRHVPSGTSAACYQEPARPNSSSQTTTSGSPNSEANLHESNSSEVGCCRDGGKRRGGRHDPGALSPGHAHPYRIDLA
jgi:plasmid replication initiation protein